MAPKLSQDLQMTPQRAPKEPPKTPLDGPKPRRNRSKRCFRHKKKLASIPPYCNRDFAVFRQPVEKTVQFVKKGNTPMEKLQKMCFRHAKKKLAGIPPSSGPDPAAFLQAVERQKHPDKESWSFFILSWHQSQWGRRHGAKPLKYDFCTASHIF